MVRYIVDKYFWSMDSCVSQELICYYIRQYWIMEVKIYITSSYIPPVCVYPNYIGSRICWNIHYIQVEVGVKIISYELMGMKIYGVLYIRNMMKTFWLGFDNCVCKCHIFLWPYYI